MWLLRRVGFRVEGLLKGSWDLVTRVINKVTILIITYNPKSPDPPSRGLGLKV